MNISDMRHRIEINKEGKLFHSCYAGILEMYGKEKETAMANKTESIIKFKIRYCDKLKELRKTKLFTIKYDGYEYNLKDIDFNNFKKDKIILYTTFRS